jgi:Fe2+ transport system protein B
VITVDAFRLAQGLYLVAQDRELTTRVVVAVTMSDVAHREMTVDTATLSRELGYPVVTTDPCRHSPRRDHRRHGDASRHRPPNGFVR